MSNDKRGNSETGGSSLNYGPLSNMIGVELRNSQYAAERAWAELCDIKIVPGHFTILMLIRNNPGQNQTSLANAAKLDRSTMVPILDHFEKHDWVQRRPCAGDRRAYALHLTKKGQSLLNKLESYVEQMEKRISDGLGKKKREQLLDLLREFQKIIL